MTYSPSKIERGCARILWGLAWADHAEETECQSLRGCDILEEMPELGTGAYFEAGRVIGAVETASGMNISALLWACLKADGRYAELEWREHAERFGECLAYMALGHGISWEDEYTPCAALKVPNMEVDLYADVALACRCAP